MAQKWEPPDLSDPQLQTAFGPQNTTTEEQIVLVARTDQGVLHLAVVPILSRARNAKTDRSFIRQIVPGFGSLRAAATKAQIPNPWGRLQSDHFSLREISSLVKLGILHSRILQLNSDPRPSFQQK